jgi:hypothetical protein
MLVNSSVGPSYQISKIYYFFKISDDMCNIGNDNEWGSEYDWQEGDWHSECEEWIDEVDEEGGVHDDCSQGCCGQGRSQACDPYSLSY